VKTSISRNILVTDLSLGIPGAFVHRTIHPCSNCSVESRISPYIMEASTISGAAILLLDLPTSALGGIDLLSFTTTPRFKGIKNIPPGIHFAFTSSTADLSIRHGVWFRVKEYSNSHLQLFIKNWDTQKEELLPLRNDADILRWRANVGSIWRESLSPYRQNTTKEELSVENQDWRLLTEHISDAILSRITGEDADHWSLTSASSADRDKDNIPGLSESTAYQKEKKLNFIPVELKKTWRPGSTGRERTDGARDHSWALGELIDSHCEGDDMQFLGELQFCFIMILTLNNYSCMEQWKHLWTLLFTSISAVKERTALYVRVLRCLSLQLQHSQDVDGGLFDLSDDGAGQLKNILRKFKKNVADMDGTAKNEVLDELEELEATVRDQYGWNLDDNFIRRGMMTLEDGERVEVTMPGYEEEDESGEYAPTVVELTADQLKELGETPIHHESNEDESDSDGMDMRY
jgi:A1 cistron-splicing factor AAR2